MDKALVFLKPDAVLRRYIGANVIKLFQDDPQIEILTFEEVRINKDLVDAHYGFLKGRCFYNWLVDYVCSGPVLVTVCRGEDITKHIRNLLGDTICERAPKESVRGRYGIYGGVNVVHASDSPQTAVKELYLWNSIYHFNLDEINANKKASTYVNRWIKYHVDYTMELRELSFKIAKDHLLKLSLGDKIKSLLREECKEVLPSDFESFSNVVINNCLL
ncbi:MAG: nucleoside-diphosphate kinase [Candidatus Methanoperedens sp.]